MKSKSRKLHPVLKWVAAAIPWVVGIAAAMLFSQLVYWIILQFAPSVIVLEQYCLFGIPTPIHYLFQDPSIHTRMDWSTAITAFALAAGVWSGFLTLEYIERRFPAVK